MCGVIVVDAGRSRSTNLGCDAYIMIIAWISSWLFEFYQFPNSNCFPVICYFVRENPLVKPTAPGSVFIIFAFAIYFPLLLFSDLLNQKYLAALYFIWRSIYQYLLLSHVRLPIFGAATRKGLTTPFIRRVASICLFACRCCLRGVRRFSYWFDNLGLITEGNTYRRCAASSLPLWGNTDVASSPINVVQHSFIISYNIQYTHILDELTYYIMGRKEFSAFLQIIGWLTVWASSGSNSPKVYLNMRSSLS